MPCLYSVKRLRACCASWMLCHLSYIAADGYDGTRTCDNQNASARNLFSYKQVIAGMLRNPGFSALPTELPSGTLDWDSNPGPLV